MEFKKFELIQEAGKENNMEQKINNLASLLHDKWRAPRFKKEIGDYGPKIEITKDKKWSGEHGGKTEVDIANTRYEDLPSDWQEENKASAKVAVEEVEKAMTTGIPLDDLFLESASSVLHDKWLEINTGSESTIEQKKPYTELSEEEKERDRAIIRKAIEIYAKEKSGLRL